MALLDSYASSNQSSSYILYSGSYSGVAQAFANPTAKQLTSVWFWIRKAGTPTGTVSAKLYAVTGTVGSNATPTGSALATSEVLDPGGFGTSYALVEFVFPASYTMAASTNYAISVEYSGGSNLNYVEVGSDVTSPTHAGNGSYGFGGWFGAVDDLIFSLYGADNLQTLTVTGEGAVTSGWADEGGSYTRVQSDDGDTSRLYTPTNAVIRTLTHTATSGLTSMTINSVTIYAKVRNLISVSSTNKLGVRIGSTNYFSSDLTNFGTSYVTIKYEMTTNPVTGVAWTAAGVDGTEYAIQKTDSIGTGWTYALMVVDYSAGGGGSSPKASTALLMGV